MGGAIRLGDDADDRVRGADGLERGEREGARIVADGRGLLGEPGFFLGSIYINYGLTAVIVTISYVVLLLVWRVPEKPLLLGAITFTVVFPILLFPWARSIFPVSIAWRTPSSVS